MSATAQGLFITGTDTGVGKTVVTTALLALLRQRGVDAVPMKPVQTGCRKHHGKFVAPDLAFCLRMAGLIPPAEERAWMCPYQFVPACSPHLAAQRARCPIQLQIIRDNFCHLGDRHGVVLAEGAGGVLTPIGGGRNMLDVMRVLKLPALVVTRPGLGTINHTLLTLAALRNARLQIAGVVIADTQDGRWGQIARDNAVTIARLGDVQIIGHMPFLPALADGRMAPSEFCMAVQRFSRAWKIKSPGFPNLVK